MQNRQLKRFIIALLIVIAIPFYAIADPEDMGGDPATPIDGGLTVLLAAGVGYGAKKYYDTRKKKEDQDSNNNK